MLCSFITMLFFFIAVFPALLIFRKSIVISYFDESLEETRGLPRYRRWIWLKM